MNTWVVILLIVAIVAVAIALLAVVTVLTVWGASGLGWMLIHWLHLPFSAFEATLVSLVTFAIVTYSALRLLVALTTTTFPSLRRPEEDEDEWEDDDDDEDEWDEDEDEDEDEDDEQRPTPDLVAPVPSIPKWRQPIRSVPRVAPDDRCPCGSGRKYKNCHGRKTT